METKVEGSELLVDSLVEDPVEIEADEFVTVGVCHSNFVRILYERDCHHVVVLGQRDL